MWIRLSSAYIPIGTGVPKYSGTKEYYSTGSVSCDGFIPEGCYSYENRPSRANRICFKNDLIDAKMQSTNKCIIIKENLDGMLFSTGFYCFRALINSIEYLQNFINSDYFQKAKDSLCTGVTQKAINDDKLFNILIPLPPLNEQHRINFQLLKIAALIQTYERQEKQLSYLESSFEEKLKASILQYAIEGRLVKQDPNDEPASVLLEHIKAEKEKLIKEGKIKRDKHDSEIVVGVDKNYYEKDIPTGWVLANIGQLGILTRGFGIKRSDITENGYPCIRYGELYTTYKVSFSSAVSYTSLEIWKNAFKAKQNDIFMTLTGENKKDISMALAYLGENQIAYGGDMTCLSNHHMNPLYLVYAINSPYGRNCMQQLSTGDIIVHMSNDKLAKIRIPIPPFSEQNKIIDKINRIVSLL